MSAYKIGSETVWPGRVFPRRNLGEPGGECEHVHLTWEDGGYECDTCSARPLPAAPVDQVAATDGQWLVADPSEMDFYGSEAEALSAARFMIERHLCDDVWSEDADEVIVARVTHVAKRVQVDHPDPDVTGLAPIAEWVGLRDDPRHHLPPPHSGIGRRRMTSTVSPTEIVVTAAAVFAASFVACVAVVLVQIRRYTA